MCNPLRITTSNKAFETVLAPIQTIHAAAWLTLDYTGTCIWQKPQANCIVKETTPLEIFYGYQSYYRHKHFKPPDKSTGNSKIFKVSFISLSRVSLAWFSYDSLGRDFCRLNVSTNCWSDKNTETLYLTDHSSINWWSRSHFSISWAFYSVVE